MEMMKWLMGFVLCLRVLELVCDEAMEVLSEVMLRMNMMR